MLRKHLEEMFVENKSHKIKKILNPIKYCNIYKNEFVED